MTFENKMVHPVECHCLSWKPIFAGALTGIGLAFLLKLFGVAIGLTAYTSSSGTESIVLGGLIGTTIGVIASMFTAGWIAGYLGTRHCTKRHLGALYGFLAWCVGLIAAVLLTGPMMHYIMLYSHLLSGNMDMLNMPPMNNLAKNIVVNDQAAAPSITISAYILFGLFFISAFSSSLGGHCGMLYRCKSEC